MLQAHLMGYPPGKIADDFGVTEATVRNGIRRAIRDRMKLEVDELRVTADEELNMLRRQLNRILRHPKYVVAVTGKIVTDPETGKPLVDYSETRQIIMAILKINESQRKLNGVDMPIRHKVEITDKMDAEIEKLAQDLAMNGAGAPAIESVPEGEPELIPDE